MTMVMRKRRKSQFRRASDFGKTLCPEEWLGPDPHYHAAGMKPVPYKYIQREKKVQMGKFDRLSSTQKAFFREKAIYFKMTHADVKGWEDEVL
jgi:hypothetical protein